MKTKLQSGFLDTLILDAMVLGFEAIVLNYIWHCRKLAGAQSAVGPGETLQGPSGPSNKFLMHTA